MRSVVPVREAMKDVKVLGVAIPGKIETSIPLLVIYPAFKPTPLESVWKLKLLKLLNPSARL